MPIPQELFFLVGWASCPSHKFMKRTFARCLLMDKQACDALWAAFNESSLYVIGCEAAQNSNWLAAGSFNDSRRHATPEEIEPVEANATAAA